MSDKGRWFRVYALQLRDHPKFRSLTAVEIGAWTALRSEAELRAGAVIADRAEAILILKRRKVSRPAAVLDRLVALALFDVGPEGRVSVHDRDDHDRPFYPSDTPAKMAERKRRSREGNESDESGHDDVTTRDMNSHDTHGGASAPDRAGKPNPPQPTSSANSQPPQPAGDGLPADDDSATAACRLFINGGRWLGDREYVEAWDDMDRRFGKQWVQTEIQPAYQRLHAENPKVKPWVLKSAVEMACAERVRMSEIERDRAQSEVARLDRERLKTKEDSASEEEKSRASVVRRAIGLWIKQRPTEPVPTDYDQLASWLEKNGASA